MKRKTKIQSKEIEKVGGWMKERFSRLPEICATRLLTTGEPIFIRLGGSTYSKAHGVDPEQFNEGNGVTDAQVHAMEVGSMFGWEVDGADPALYEYVFDSAP